MTNQQNYENACSSLKLAKKIRKENVGSWVAVTKNVSHWKKEKKKYRDLIRQEMGAIEIDKSSQVEKKVEEAGYVNNNTKEIVIVYEFNSAFVNLRYPEIAKPLSCIIYKNEKGETHIVSTIQFHKYHTKVRKI